MENESFPQQKSSIHQQKNMEHPTPSNHFSHLPIPPTTQNDFLQLSQLSMDELKKLPITRMDLRKIILLQQKNNPVVPSQHLNSTKISSTKNPTPIFQPPNCQEDFEKLARLREDELEKLPLTRADLDVIFKIKQNFPPPVEQEILEVAEQFAKIKNFEWKRPEKEEDYEQLLQLEKWQIARLPLTLNDRKKLVAMEEMKQKGKK